jgi:hypothetical protein
MKVRDIVTMARESSLFSAGEKAVVLAVHPDTKRVLVSFTRKMHGGQVYRQQTVIDATDCTSAAIATPKKIKQVAGIKTCNNCNPGRRCDGMPDITEVCSHYKGDPGVSERKFFRFPERYAASLELPT